MFVPFVKTEFIFYFLISRVKKTKKPSFHNNGTKSSAVPPKIKATALLFLCCKGLPLGSSTNAREADIRLILTARTDRRISLKDEEGIFFRQSEVKYKHNETEAPFNYEVIIHQRIKKSNSFAKKTQKYRLFDFRHLRQIFGLTLKASPH